jgi:hypothetical protein
MTALLRQKLILDMHSASANILEGANHVHHIESLAITGVAIHKDRQATCASNLTDEEGDLVNCNYAEVRQSHGCGHGGA